MKILTEKINGNNIAVIESNEKVIVDSQSAIDLIASVNYRTKSSLIVISKNAIAEDFFILSTGIAGDILQKFINYHAKIAIYGDFSVYTSKPLHDFIYECNNGNDIFFAKSKDDALDMLSTKV